MMATARGRNGRGWHARLRSLAGFGRASTRWRAPLAALVLALAVHTLFAAQPADGGASSAPAAPGEPGTPAAPKAAVPVDPTPILPEALEPLTARDLIQENPTNLDFSAGPLGARPPAWFFAGQGYTALVGEPGPKGVKRAVALLPDPRQPADAMGVLSQSIGGAGASSKMIEFSAWVRVEAGGAVNGTVPPQARLMLRVDTVLGRVGFFDNMADRPIRPGDWRRVKLLGPIDEGTAMVSYGVMALGGARVLLADVGVRIFDAPNDGGNAPASPLSERGVQNVSALVRAWGQVRYFHPSTESQGVDWDALLMAGIDRVEGAADAPALRTALEEVFKPVAPGVQFFITGEGMPPPEQFGGPEIKSAAGWRHLGLGQSNPVAPAAGQIYKSTRLVLPIDQAGDGKQIPKPGTTSESALPGGVTLRMPIVMLADSAGTLPHGAPGATPIALDRPDGWRESLSDRTVRLASVGATWAAMRHFYPYFSVVKTDWSAALEPALREAAEAKTLPEALDGVRRLTAQLKDGHAQVVHADVPVASIIDLGWTFVGDDLVVTRVPARWQEYIRPGDIVQGLDKKPIESGIEAIKPLISAATEGWMRKSLAQGLRTSYKTPASFTITLVRPGDEQTKGEPFTLRLQRRPVGDIGPEESWLLEESDTRPADGSELAPGVVYFDLCGKGAKALQEVMPALSKAQGIVFDLRGYPGDAAYQLLAQLAGEDRLTSARWTVPIVTLPDQPELRFQTMPPWVIAGRDPRLGVGRKVKPDLPAQKVAFLIDARCISYAESILGIVEYFKLGELVGEPTAGTNGNINPIRVPGGAIVYWTGMRVIKHDGSVHHGQGIRPTIPVSRTRAGIAAGRDEQLEAAIKAVSPTGAGPSGR